MIFSKEKTVANYVTENIKTAQIFKKYGIDFCCGGNISVEKACIQKNINIELIRKQLSEVDNVKDLMEDYDKWELDFLIDYIINIHHTYINENLPIISQYINRVIKTHNNKYTELLKINQLFHQLANELQSHLHKEEQILFPSINLLIRSKSEEKLTVTPPFKTINNPIQMMEYEHENASNTFKKIAELTNNYTPPKGACNTYKTLYIKLKEFEQNLHMHVHLENNILHPKALLLEVKFNS